MVYYRKYRPQIIEELDSEIVRETLKRVLVSPSHAFLFTGPKGLGKTSAARIVAKAVNCERLASSKLASSSKEKKLNAKRYTLDANYEPCNKCVQCVSIINGTNLDVLEIDGASNRGIDEIRDLREKIRLLPVAAQRKVYIIDEVHMLTSEAFNALLKTLEEPPPHAMLILCTTEPQKVPETILSRCSRVVFQKAKEEELERSLTRVVKKEKLNVKREALLAMASLADGSFRDAVKILEELAGFGRGNKKITKELVENKYQVSSIKYQVSEMIGFMVDKDVKKSLGLISKLADQGADVKFFIEQMINALHEQLLIKIGIKNKELGIKNKELGIEDIKRLVELLTKAHSELKYAVLPQLPLELMVIEWTDPIASFSGRGPVKSFPPASARSEYSPLANNSLRAVRSPSTFATPHNNLWSDLIEKVKVHNHSIAGILRGCALRSYDNSKIVIETGYKFHKDRLSDKKILGILEKAWEEVTGKRIEIAIELKNK